jgi:hypothetical protein
VFTARYALSPYVKQIRFVFKGLMVVVVVVVVVVVSQKHRGLRPLTPGACSAQPVTVI